MTKQETLIRSLMGLGQSVPKQARKQVFADITDWVRNQPVNHAGTKGIEVKNNPDVQKAVDLIKRTLKHLDPQQAVALLGYAQAFTNVLEGELAEQARHNNTIEYVTTQPDYLKEIDQAAATAALWGGTLFDAISGIIRNATTSVDIINPYWSINSVEQLLLGLGNQSSHFRVLTMLMGKARHRNEAAIHALVQKVQKAGATITIYSPTDEQIRLTDAIAPIHAKLILCDDNVAYIGSANLSKGGLQNGLEIGAIHRGPALRPLVAYTHWIFTHSALCTHVHTSSLPT